LNTVDSPIPSRPMIEEDRTGGRFRVDRRVFTDADVFALERERIFGRCWLYLAHTSEVPASGSFISREVGGKPILLTRDREGVLRAFYNSCAHRGTMICRERSGKTPTFVCPYHAWSFDLKGKLIGMPGPGGLVADANSDGSLNLRQVEKLDEFKGFIFLCFDPRAEPLVSYLAGATDYLAYIADQGPAGMEIVGGTQEYAIDANWKLLQENSADGYHGAPTHSTYFDYIQSRDGQVARARTGQSGWVKNLGNGHAVGESIGEMPWGRPYARWVPGWGEEGRAEVAGIEREIMDRLGPERGAVVCGGDRNLIIFPNLVVNDIMAITVRTFYSPSVGKMDVNSWALAPVGESKTSRDRRLRNFLEFLGPAGFATPDDVEMLEIAQKGYATGGYNDASRGMLMANPSKTEELQLRTFWRRWNQLMTDGSLEGLAGP
jgi:p-cumate 2,3-dioxygenase subunit alpha